MIVPRAASVNSLGAMLPTCRILKDYQNLDHNTAETAKQLVQEFGSIFLSAGDGSHKVAAKFVSVMENLVRLHDELWGLGAGIGEPRMGWGFAVEGRTEAFG